MTSEATLVDNDFNDRDSVSLEPTVITRSSADLPHDKKRRVQISFGLIGIASLMPWSIFVTATDYWMYKFRDVNASHTGLHPNKTEMQTFFFSYLSIASNVPFLMMLIINSVVAQKSVTLFTRV
jgi:equilibrative nucleoside transporter 1/2/3